MNSAFDDWWKTVMHDPYRSQTELARASWDAAIERCAKVADEWGSPLTAKSIRALVREQQDQKIIAAGEPDRYEQAVMGVSDRHEHEL